MEFDKSLRPKVGIAVWLMNPEGKVLFMKRKNAHGEGTWAPPGGHLEGGEEFLESMQREVKEETDIDLQGIEFLGVTNDVFSPEKHYVTLFMSATSYTGEAKVMEPEKCEEIGWFELNNPPRPLFLSIENFFESECLCSCRSKKQFKECHLR